MDVDGQAASGRVPPPCAVRTVPLAPVSLSAVPTDPSSLMLGTQDGGVFVVKLSPQGEASVSDALASAGDPFGLQGGFSLASSFWAEAAARASSNKAVPAGHDGVVTGMAHHPSFRENALLGDAFVTGCSDWTVRVWSPRLSQGPIVSIHGPPSAALSVSWCPRASHPGVLAACYADGSVLLWDVPQVSRQGVAAESCAHFKLPSGVSAAHVLWLQGTMRSAPPLLVVDSAGSLHVLDSAPALARASGGGSAGLLDCLNTLSQGQVQRESE